MSGAAGGSASIRSRSFRLTRGGIRQARAPSTWARRARFARRRYRSCAHGERCCSRPGAPRCRWTVRGTSARDRPWADPGCRTGRNLRLGRHPHGTDECAPPRASPGSPRSQAPAREQIGTLPGAMVHPRFRVRHPDRRQRARPMKPGRHRRVPSIGLHPVAGLHRDEGRRRRVAGLPAPGRLPMRAIPARSGLAAEGRCRPLAHFLRPGASPPGASLERRTPRERSPTRSVHGAIMGPRAGRSFSRKRRADLPSPLCGFPIQ